MNINDTFIMAQECNEIDGTCENTAINSDSDEIEKVPLGANAQGKPREAEKTCKDRHAACVGFAERGECEINPGWMIMFCAASCNACELRDPYKRCDRKFLNISTEPIYAPGDMQSMFQSIEERFADKYDVDIISRDPWVVTFDNFVEDHEIEALIRTNNNSWERSTDTGSTNEFGETGRILSSGRTSANSWCRHECESHPDVSNVMAKIEEVTNIPRTHYESFQVLKYDVGQYYRTHHDYGGDDRRLPCGPRILTFFLYLSDVDEGGETGFPTLGINVQPKKGRALLWPSTISEDPSRREPRTMHEAKTVLKGRKYAANSWIHLYDYAKPNLWGCTGTFDELTHD